MTSRISLTASWIQIATGASIVSCEGAIEVAYSDTLPVPGDPGHDLETESDPLQYAGASKTWARARWPGSIAIVSGAGAVASVAPQALVAPQVTLAPGLTPANPQPGDAVVVDPGAATGVPAPVVKSARLTVAGKDVSLDGGQPVMPAAGAWELDVVWTNGTPPDATVRATGIVGTVALPERFEVATWTLTAKPAEPDKYVISFSPLPASVLDIISVRQQVVPKGGSGWSGASGFTNYPALPQAGFAYDVALPPAQAGLAGTEVDVRIFAVNSLSQAGANFSLPKSVTLAPAVSAVTDTATGQTTATLTASTTGTGGTIYFAPMATAPTGTAAQKAAAVKAASVALGAAWRKAVTAPGTQTLNLTGLTAGTSFAPVYAVHELASGLISNSDAGDGFATQPVVATAPAQFAAGSWSFSPVANDPTHLAIMFTALPADNGAAITAVEYRLNGATTGVQIGIAPDTDYLVTVPAGAQASITIAAVNSVGTGPQAAAKTATPWVGVLATAVTVTEPPEDHYMLDAGMFREHAAGRSPWTPAGATYTMAGTATGAQDGTTVALSLVAAPTPYAPRLLRGAPANATIDQLHTAIKSNAPEMYAEWRPLDRRTAAQWQAATPNTSFSTPKTIRITGTPAGGKPKYLVLPPMDFGDVGIWVDGPWIVAGRGAKLAHLNLTGGAIVDVKQMIFEGRGDGSEWWAPYLVYDTIRVDDDSSLYLDDFIITGHAKDAIKHIGGGPNAAGVIHIRNGYVNAPVQYQAAPAPYSAATAYAVGDVFYAIGTTTGPRCFRVLQPFTDYAATAGQALPVWSSGVANAWIQADDIHGDGYQDIAGSSRTTIENVVMSLGVADRLKGPKTLASVPIANAALYVGISGPGATPVNLIGIKVEDPDDAWKAVNVGGGDAANISGLRLEAGAQLFDITGAVVKYRDIKDTAGNVLTPPAPAVLDNTLPLTDGNLATAPRAAPAKLDLGTALVTANAWSKVVTVPWSAGVRWAQKATIGAVSDTTTNRLQVGLTIVPEEASNLKKAFLASAGEPAISGLGGIGNGEGDFQVLGGDADYSLANPTINRWLVCDATPYTYPCAVMAQIAARCFPGVPILIAINAQSGAVGYAKALDDSENPVEWAFAGMAKLFSEFGKGGAKVGLWSFGGIQNASDDNNASEIAHAHLWGVTRAGAVIPGIANPGPFASPGTPANAGTYNHIVAEAVPEIAPYDTGYTVFMQRRNNVHDKSTLDLANTSPRQTMLPILRADRNAGGNYRVAPTSAIWNAADPRQEIGGADIGVHMEYTSPDGEALHLTNYLYGMVRAAGVAPNETPVWVVDAFTPGYVELHVEVGGVEMPVTTRALQRGITTKFPALVDNGAGLKLPTGAPGSARVLGFMSGSLNDILPTEIIDPVTKAVLTAPGSQGRVRVYPPAGGSFNGNSKIYPGVNGAGIPLSTTIGTAAWSTAGSASEGYSPHLPVVRMPLPGGSFLAHVVPPVDMEIINAANTLTAPFGVDYYSPILSNALNTGYDLPAPTTPTADAITVELVVEHATGGIACCPLSINSNAATGGVRLTPAGAINFSIANNSNVTIFAAQTADGVVAPGQRARVRLTAERVNPTTGKLHCWVDYGDGAGFVNRDSAQFGDAVAWTSGSFADVSNRQFHIGRTSYTDAGRLGVLAVVQGQAIAATTALTYTAANLYVRATAAETGFEKWVPTPAPGGFVAL